MTSTIDTSPPEATNKKTWFTKWDIPLLVGIICFKALVFDWNHIPTNSMFPTIHPQDHVLINKHAFSLRVPLSLDNQLTTVDMPSRGDVVTFSFELIGGANAIKRVVGIEGDTVEVRGTQVFVNGDIIPRKLINSVDGYAYFVETHGGVTYNVRYRNGIIPDAENLRVGSWVVPKGKFLAMGDNRDHSRDTRFMEDGSVSIQKLHGKAMSVVANINLSSFKLSRYGCSMYDAASNSPFAKTCGLSL